MKIEKYRRLRRYSRGAIAFIVMLLSLLVVFISEDSNWKNISIAVVSTSLVIIIYEIFTKTFEEQFIFDYLPMFKESQEIGLKKILYKPFDDENYKNDLLHTYKLLIVMNDGKTFLRNYHNILQQRINRKGVTQFILLNPDSKFVEYLNERNEKETKDYYKYKIKDVIKELKEIIKNKSNIHQFEIFVHDGFHPYAVVMCDDKAMVSMYRLSPGKHEVLHFLFEDKGKNSEFEKIKLDIEKLKNKAKKIESEESI